VEFYLYLDDEREQHKHIPPALRAFGRVALGHRRPGAHAMQPRLYPGIPGRPVMVDPLSSRVSRFDLGMES
jgi:hypothetical protein